MHIHRGSARTAGIGVLLLLAACATKDATIGSMNPGRINGAGSSGTDPMSGAAGSDGSQGGTGPQSSGGIAGAGRGHVSGASGSGTTMGGGGGAFGAGSSAGGRAGAAAGSGAMSGGGGSAGSAPDVSPAGSPLIAVSYYHACVIVNGQVYCWGTNLYGETGAEASDVAMPLVTVPNPESKMAAITVGDGHTCALGTSGKVYCWGNNFYGQLGHAPTSMGGSCLSGSCDHVPQAVTGLDGVVQVVASANRTCARLADGTVRCWGDVANGISDWADTITNATSIAVAQAGACATTTAGTLSCSFDLPAETMAIQGVRQVVLSPRAQDWERGGFGGFGCVLGDVGSVTCFGENTHGELGAGSTGVTGELRPALAAGVAGLALGIDHACAIDQDGVLQCWGVNSKGAVAGFPLSSPNCKSNTCESSPRRVLGLPRAVAVSAGEQTCALAADGTVWCWGTTYYTYSAGAPIRMVGPWERGGNACLTSLHELAARREFEFESNCSSNADCVAVPLDLSCDHTCAVAGIGRDQLDRVAERMAVYEAEYCAPAAAADCAAPTLSCPPLTEQAICQNGRCTFYAPERTGCPNRCYCDAERFGALLAYQGTGCDGFDLQPNDVACDVCEGGGADVVVGNTGTSDFDGDVVISFEYPTVSTPPVPEPKTVTLHLAPGERSDPIHFDTDSTAGAKVRVTAAGDCRPENDGTFNVTFPGPAQDCR